jgi:hypothetical protein
MKRVTNIKMPFYSGGGESWTVQVGWSTVMVQIQYFSFNLRGKRWKETLPKDKAETVHNSNLAHFLGLSNFGGLFLTNRSNSNFREQFRN